MSRPLLWKIGAILFVAAALVVPLRMIVELVEERRALRDKVVREVAHGSAGAQRLEGIVLVLPCTEHYDERETLDDGRQVVRNRTRSCERQLLPERLELDGDLDTALRARGIYTALVYRSALKVAGAFKIPASRAAAGLRRTWGEPQLAVGIADVRGLRGMPALAWNGASVALAAGPGPAPWKQGVHAPVSIDPEAGGEAAFTLELDLAGMERLEIVPSAGEVNARLRSAWPHPGFVGRFAPETRSVGGQGFEAAWHASDLATNIRQSFQRCVRGSCDEYLAAVLGVSLVQTVDVYHRTYRALQYGFLFVALTFALFFLYEVLGGLRVHPIQYALVGLALVIFFVLLLAFAEHLGFGSAYLLAASACIGLIAAYVRYVLGSVGRAASMGALLAALYGAMYAVLGSEDYALLTGALLLFVALAAFMLSTRRLDWYALPGGEPATARQAPSA